MVPSIIWWHPLWNSILIPCSLDCVSSNNWFANAIQNKTYVMVHIYLQKRKNAFDHWGCCEEIFAPSHIRGGPHLTWWMMLITKTCMQSLRAALHGLSHLGHPLDVTLCFIGFELNIWCEWYNRGFQLWMYTYDPKYDCVQARLTSLFWLSIDLTLVTFPSRVIWKTASVFLWQISNKLNPVRIQNWALLP